jgi:hypothetical protein
MEPRVSWRVGVRPDSAPRYSGSRVERVGSVTVALD